MTSNFVLRSLFNFFEEAIAILVVGRGDHCLDIVKSSYEEER
jgi:hypothetical protein